MEQLCRTILVNTLLSILRKNGFLLFILVLMLSFDFLQIKLRKRNNSSWISLLTNLQIKTKLSIHERITIKIIAIIVLCSIIMFKVIPISIDLVQENYQNAYVDYTKSSTSSNILSNGSVTITVNGEEKRLELPSNWTAAEFPQGTYEGRVWWSERSKYILIFEPTGSIFD